MCRSCNQANSKPAILEIASGYVKEIPGTEQTCPRETGTLNIDSLDHYINVDFEENSQH